MTNELHSYDNLHVLFIAAEADPLVKAGGLGDVAGSLPVALNNIDDGKNLEIKIAIPFYNSIKQKRSISNKS